MMRRLRRIAPAPTGLTLGALYGCAGLVAAPLFYLMTRIVPPAAPRLPGLGIAFMLGMPFLYAIMGFLMGYVGSLLYNWIARYTGGIQYEADVMGDAA